MSRIELNVVALGNFSSLTKEIDLLKAQVAALNKNIGAIGLTSQQLSSIKNMTGELNNAILSSGQFTAKTIALQTETEKFGKALDAGKLKLKEYYSIISQGSKQAQSQLRALAIEQTKLQNSIIVRDPLKGGMATVFTPKNINETANAIQIATNQQRLYNLALDRGATSLINWGKNTQWAGRQLTVGLTVPMTMFGSTTARIFQQMDQELTRMQKVYGTGLAQPTQQALAAIRKDVSVLAKELAQAWGVPIQETAGMAADLAATGKTGLDLVNATRESIRLAKLGEVDRQQAMQATISLQNVYKLNTTQLANAVNFLNAVENQTSTSLQDLVDAIPRVGPIVAQLGGSFKDTAAMMVAMKEAGVPAAQSANAIKSAMASLINPSRDAQKTFRSFGIDLAALSKRTSGNPILMIKELSAELKNLDKLTQAQLIEKLFGKFQFSRVQALVDNLNRVGSQAQTVFNLMNASDQQLSKMAQAELKVQTESTTGKFKRTLETLKADLIPVGEEFTKIITKLLEFGDSVVNMASHLGPLKSILGVILGFVSVAGPILMLAGVFGNLFGYIFKGVSILRNLSMGTKNLASVTGLLTAENIAATNASKIFGSSLLQEASDANILKNAIAQLTLQMEGLVGVQSAASTSLLVAKPGVADKRASKSNRIGLNEAQQMLISGAYVGTTYKSFKPPIPGLERTHLSTNTAFQGAVPDDLVSKVRMAGNSQDLSREDLRQAYTNFVMFTPSNWNRGNNRATGLEAADWMRGETNGIKHSVAATDIMKKTILAQLAESMDNPKSAKAVEAQVDKVMRTFGNNFTKLIAKVEAVTDAELERVATQAMDMTLKGKTVSPAIKQAIVNMKNTPTTISAYGNLGAYAYGGAPIDPALLLAETSMITNGTQPQQQPKASAKTGFLSKLRGRAGGGMTGLAAMMLLNMFGDKLPSGVGNVAGGAATGAMIGSFIPVPGGTLIGAGIGAAISGISELIKKEKEHEAAVKASFSVAASAAQMFGSSLDGVTLSTHKLYDITQKTTTGLVGIRKYADEIKKLDATDPLKITAESLKGMSSAKSIIGTIRTFVAAQVAAGMDPSKVNDMVAALLAYAGRLDLVNLAQQSVLESTKDLGTATTTWLNKLHDAAGNIDLNAKSYNDLSEKQKTYADSILLVINRILAMETPLANVKALIDSVAISSGTAAEKWQALKLAAANLSDTALLGLFNALSGMGFSPEQGAFAALVAQYNPTAMENAMGTKIAANPKIDPAIRNAILNGGDATNINELLKNPKTWEGVAEAKNAAIDKKVSTMSMQLSDEERLKLLQKQKKTIDEQIAAQQKITEELKKQQDYLVTRTDLENQIKMAMASGDYLKANLLRQQLAAKQQEFTGSQVLTPLQALSDKIQKAIDALQEKMNATTTNAQKEAIDTLKKTKVDSKQFATDMVNAYTDSMSGKDTVNVDGKNVYVNKTDPKNLYEATQNAINDKNNTTIAGNKIYNEPLQKQGITPESINDQFKIYEYNGKQYAVDLNTGTVYPVTGMTKDGRYITQRPLGQSDNKKLKAATGGHIKHFGPGGDVNGPGTATSDSIPAYLSNGEYVINASAVNKYGTELFDGLNAKRFHKGGAAGHKHLSSEHASSQYKAPKSLMQKIWDNILFPTALWADRLQSGLSGTQPIATTNLVQEALWDKQAREQGISSVIKPMAAQTVSDIAGLAVPGKAVSAAARMGLEGYGATRGIYGLGNLIPQKGAASYALSSASKFGAAAAIKAFKPLNTDIVEWKKEQIQVYSGGPFGKERIAYQDRNVNLNGLTETGMVDRIIPMNAEGILSYALTKQPNNKRLQTMLDNFISRDPDRLGLNEQNLLSKIHAALYYSDDTKLSNPKELALLIQELLGNRSARKKIKVRLKKQNIHIESVLSKSLKNREEEFKRWNKDQVDDTNINPDQIPMYRAFEYPWRMDEYGNAYENSAGMEMWSHNTPRSQARITRHLTPFFPVTPHLAGSWEDLPMIVSSAGALMRHNGPMESFHAKDSWFSQLFGKRFIYPKDEMSRITPFKSESEYVAKLKEHELYQEGRVPIIAEDPGTKQVFYLNKDEYSSEELNEILKEIEKSDAIMLKSVFLKKDNIFTPKQMLKALAMFKAEKQIGINGIGKVPVNDITFEGWNDTLEKQIAKKIDSNYDPGHYASAWAEAEKDLVGTSSVIDKFLHGKTTDRKKIMSQMLMSMLHGNVSSRPTNIELSNIHPLEREANALAQFARIQEKAKNGEISSSQLQNFTEYYKKLLKQIEDDKRKWIPEDKNGGYIKKYHSGGVVQGAYGQEVLAMLQGGEVVLPKELGKRTNYQTSSSILDSVTKNLNSSFNVTINVPNTNASPQEIAQVVMRTIKYEQGRAYTSGRVV